MFEVDRIVAVVKPTEVMLDFLLSLPHGREDISLSQLRSDCTALLIPAFNGPKQARQFIERHYAGIFENELEAWDVSQSLWPQDRTLEKFQAWFYLEFHYLVFDIAEFDKLAKENQVID